MLNHSNIMTALWFLANIISVLLFTLVDNVAIKVVMAIWIALAISFSGLTSLGVMMFFSKQSKEEIKAMTS